MSLPTYVVNWDELAEAFVGDININIEDIDTTLKDQLPEIIKLLEEIKNAIHLNKNKFKGYDQKIDGFLINTDSPVHTVDLVKEKNCYLTGVTCSHSHIEAVDDFFILSLIKTDESTGQEIAEIIFEKVYLKDALQHKHFNKYFPVPKNTKVKITHNNSSNIKKSVWYDVEYLEFFGIRENETWEDVAVYD